MEGNAALIPTGCGLLLGHVLPTDRDQGVVEKALGYDGPLCRRQGQFSAVGKRIGRSRVAVVRCARQREEKEANAIRDGKGKQKAREFGRTKREK